jgi:hypothetical protein
MKKKRRKGETEERLLPRVRLISAGSYHAKVNETCHSLEC